MSASIQYLLNNNSEFLLTESIINFHKGKKILITGAGGSVGSELAFNLAKVQGVKLVFLDISELALFNLESRLAILSQGTSCFYELADICDQVRMQALFATYSPEIVYHAAAYKHVKFMEMNPYEAIKVNIEGTMNLARLSLAYSCQKFVFVSTDKAVNPAGIMGASKRIAELYVRSFVESETDFITVRFGNVLGSSGSLIPKIEKQIEEGGPVTLTHGQAERFFMSKSDACSLVLESGAMGKNRELYMFNIKESIKIKDVVQQMLIRYSKEDSVEVKVIGLMEGEKLKEELVGIDELTEKTGFSSILRIKPKVDRICIDSINGLISKNKQGLIKNYRREIAKIILDFPMN